MFFKTSACQNGVRIAVLTQSLVKYAPLFFFTSKLILSSILLQYPALLIDLSRIPVGDDPNICFLQSNSVIHFFYNLKGHIFKVNNRKRKEKSQESCW